MAAQYKDTITTRSGSVIPGAVVRALNSLGAFVTIYTDEALTQPVTQVVANDNGFALFYVPDGTYTIRISSGSVSFDIANVELYDLSTIATTASGIASGKANASAIGVTGSATNLGTFTGTIIPDNQTAKQALQALETAAEERPTFPELESNTGASLIGYGQIGGALRDLLAWLRERPVSVKDFGATGDGSTDDTVAVQDWVTHLYTNGRIGYVPKGNYKLTGNISAPAASGWGFFGDGQYKSAFFWAGVATTPDIFSFGSDSIISWSCNFVGFSVFSFSPLAGGYCFKLTNHAGAVVDDCTFGGERYAKNTWHGIWFNGTHESKLTRFDIMGLGDGIVVNDNTTGGLTTDSTGSDLWLDVGFANNCGGAGIRQAGGFGGLNIGQVQTLGNIAGQLVIDNTKSTNSNRETILSANFVADGVLVTQDNIVLNSPNSSSANIISAGTIGSGSRYGINVISWPNSYINISAGRIYNNVSDGIHMTDGSVTLVCGSGASIDTNGGLGVYSSVTNAKTSIDCYFFSNTSGEMSTTLGGWIAFSTSLGVGSGGFGSASATMRYRRRGKTMNVSAAISIPTNGTAANFITLTVPFASQGPSCLSGVGASVSGEALSVFLNGSTMTIRKANGLYPGVDGENLVIEGVYETQ